MSKSEIARIVIEPPTGETFNGGMRKRLRIELRDGRTQKFITNKVDFYCQRLNEWLVQ